MFYYTTRKTFVTACQLYVRRTVVYFACLFTSFMFLHHGWIRSDADKHFLLIHAVFSASTKLSIIKDENFLPKL